MTDATKERSAEAGVGLFVTLVITAMLLWGFALLADAFGEKGRIARLDLSVLDWLQSHGTEGGERAFVFVSWLGAPVLTAVDVAVAIWLGVSRRWQLFTLWLVAIIGGVALDETLKLVFHRARPTVASEFISGHSLSFPSGHAMNSLVGYAMLAYLLRRLVLRGRGARAAVVVAAVALIALIGFSRLYLGVHYLTDVMAGYLAGGAWVLACITAEKHVSARDVSARG